MPRKRKKKLRPKLPSRVKKTRTKRNARTGTQHPEVWGLGAVALGLFLGAVLYFGWNGGYVGGWLGDGLHRLVGDAKYVVPVVLAVLGALVVTRSALVDVRPFRTGLAVLGCGLMISLGKDQGGYLGQLMGGAVGVAIGATGSLLLGILLMLVGSLLLSGASLGAMLRRSGRSIHQAARRAGSRRTRSQPEAWPEPEPMRPALPLAPPVDAVSAFPDVVGETAAPPHAGAQPSPLQTEPPALLEDPPTLFDEVTSEHAEYRLPDAGVLRISPEQGDDSGETAARVAELLVQTLAHFGVEATVIGQISGPRVTRYELQLAPGTKVSKVAALKDDLSYALATTEIRILAPIPGKQAVGVELPNLSPNLVTLGDIFEPLPATASPVSVWLGKDISGAAVWTDLARMPHLLIAGTTGSGKSGCLNTLLTSVLLRATPDDVRLILIDPKRIELSHFEAVPHLLTPVVSSPKEASAVLANCLAEMERRYERLATVRARNLNEANRAFRQRGEPTLPYVLVVIDELADLMMVAPQAVEDAVIRLAQKSRAVGIHLVLATQRPSVDVITGMIKANVPSRIAFAVSSQTDSRVILDSGGAESLLGQGDMLFKPLGTSRLQRVQGAYVSEEEIALVVEQTRQREQELDESYLELPEVFAEPSEDGEDGEFDPDDDPLLDKAIEIVVQTQTASVSLLQRRLRVGYTRAGRLIDMLERRGIVSGYEGSKPRRVLVDESQYHSYAATE
ncbi:MAG TPA: DNA translocase FtsK 4TM domain-containing protein [Gaiellaceae bacterium]|jgi:S-DNA-T family DNA segregation ATPase FtsK/SpoIIIE|nr:DNA translocase FtsK 4TM domain-containing protein [Gaiellaceae bacterium]